jgi:pimeloyl-ACP methyl ester carboxylesterase
MQVLYLHGFASSPQSSKARFFAERFAAQQIRFDAPDLNAPDFSTLTVTRMLAAAGAIIDDAATPVVVIGSSLGGFVAIHAAHRHRDRVRAVVLLAPALHVDLTRGGSELGLAAWRSSNRLDVFHYGYGRMMPVHYELYADAARYNALAIQLPQRVQVFQGRRDTAVDPAAVERWASERSTVELHMLDDDHQLHGSLEHIWTEMDQFLHQQMP